MSEVGFAWSRTIYVYILFCDTSYIDWYKRQTNKILIKLYFYNKAVYCYNLDICLNKNTRKKVNIVNIYFHIWNKIFIIYGCKICSWNIYKNLTASNKMFTENGLNF